VKAGGRGLFQRHARLGARFPSKFWFTDRSLTESLDDTEVGDASHLNMTIVCRAHDRAERVAGDGMDDGIFSLKHAKRTKCLGLGGDRTYTGL
jgi:hypothetical protein